MGPSKLLVMPTLMIPAQKHVELDFIREQICVKHILSVMLLVVPNQPVHPQPIQSVNHVLANLVRTVQPVPHKLHVLLLLVQLLMPHTLVLVLLTVVFLPVQLQLQSKLLALLVLRIPVLPHLLLLLPHLLLLLPLLLLLLLHLLEEELLLATPPQLDLHLLSWLFLLPLDFKSTTTKDILCLFPIKFFSCKRNTNHITPSVKLYTIKKKKE